MSINLKKGSKLDLTKTNPDVVKFQVGLGWDANANNGRNFDLDVSAFILGSNGKRLSDDHFIFYNNLVAPDGSVTHTGDNLTGDGDGDDETLIVDFNLMDPNATELIIVVTIHEAEERKQNFGMVKNSYIRVYNPDNDVEILKFELDEDFSIETAVEFGRIYKKDGEWRFDAVGQGRKGGLQDYVDQF